MVLRLWRNTVGKAPFKGDTTDPLEAERFLECGEGTPVV